MGSLERAENLGRVREGGVWDVAIIGGGATGLGAAVDAATRGHRTLLLEARDFAQGTSSRSTKLIHGGVRYLANGDLPLVREALRERGILSRNAPHLVHPRDFIVPAYRWMDLFYYGTGLKLYDWLAGRGPFGPSRWLSAAEVRRRVPTIAAAGLRGGIVYTDGQFDDARLAIALARTFVDLGGTALNAMPVVGFLKQAGRLQGLRARDTETGEEHEIAARAVINATGVYVDAVRALDAPASGPRPEPLLTPSQGAHIVLDRSFLPGETAVLVPRTDDGRVLFAIPWHGRALVGTTETPVQEVVDEPRPRRDEIGYLLNHAARYLAKAPGPEDVLSTFAGLRPLLHGAPSAEGGGTAKLSREHAVFVSPSGLVTITGGKWTTYRRMAIDAIDHAEQVGGLARRPSATAELPLRGAGTGTATVAAEHANGPRNSHPSGPGPDALAIYGADAPDVRALCAERPEWDQRLHPALPYRAGEVVWAARHEAARAIDDVLARRTRALLLDARAALEAAPNVAALLAEELNQDDAWRERQLEQFRKLAEGYMVRERAPLPQTT